MWYNNRVAARATAKRKLEWSLKIEQQEIEESTKRSEASKDAVMEIGNDNKEISTILLNTNKR